MAYLNRVTLMCRLTERPEPRRVLPNGTSIIKCRVAAGRSRKNHQTGQWENDPNPLYIDCEAFAYPDAKFNLVDMIEARCDKGSQLYIEGRLQLDTWEDKNGGGKRSKHKIVIERIEFLDTQPAGTQSDYRGHLARPIPQVNADIPF